MSTEPAFPIRTIHHQLAESALTYRMLAEKADEPDLKNVLEDMSASRESMVSTLAHEVVLDGEKMPLPGSIGGIVDRIWLRVRNTLSRSKMRAVLHICERAEERLLAHYAEALAIEGLPMHVKRLLEQQRILIAINIGTLRQAG